MAYSLCLVKKIFTLLEKLLIFFISVFACRKLLVRCNVRISTLRCVYGILFSRFTYFGIGVLLTPQRSFVGTKSLNVDSYVCVCMGVPSFVFCYVPYTIPMSSVVFHVYSFFKYIFGSVLLPLMWLLTVFFTYVIFQDMQTDMNK